MEKGILVSIVVALVLVPLLGARARDARAGLRQSLGVLAAYSLVYAFLLRVVLPRLA